MSQPRRVRFFRYGCSHGVLPGDEAIMHRDGDHLVIGPVRKRGLIALFASRRASVCLRNF
jgi:antitoxin VapB